VVDLTNGFTDPDSPLGADLSQVIAAVNELLTIGRARNIPIIFSVVSYDHVREAGLWIRKVPSLGCLMSGSGAEVVDARLQPQPEEQVLVKKFGSCFFGTALASQLTSQGIDTVIVTGVSTSGCVRATVVDAVQYGFRAIIPRQAVGDRAQGPHEANLFDMQAKYGDVLDLARVKDYLQTAPR
jgi:nicotinamidase-related amidase